MQDVSFTLRRGEVLGIVALEGQGQADLFECLSGNRRPESGEILVQGKNRRFRHPHDAIGAGLVLVPADRALALLRQRSVLENIALPMVNQLVHWGLINTRSERRRVKRGLPPQRQPGEGRASGDGDNDDDDRFDGAEV